jgi:hypothetical protein
MTMDTAGVRRRHRRKRKQSVAGRIKKWLPRALLLIALAVATASLAYMVAAHINAKPPDASVSGP